MFFCVLGEYKKIMSYPLDRCVSRCREAEGRGIKEDRRDLSMLLGHREKKQQGSP